MEANSDRVETNATSSKDGLGEDSEIKQKKGREIVTAEKDVDDSKKQLDKKTPKKRQHKETENGFSRQTSLNDYFSRLHKKSRQETSLTVSTENNDRQEITRVNDEEEPVCNSPRDDGSEKSIDDAEMTYSPLSDLSKCSIEIDTEEGEEEGFDDDKEEDETAGIEEMVEKGNKNTTEIDETERREEEGEEDERKQEEGEEKEEDSASCFWSIYKLDEKRIPGCSGVSNLKQFSNILKKLFLDDEELKQTKINKNKYDTFSCMHFVCTTKDKSNSTTSHILRQMGCENRVESKGDRKTGNILVYLRIKMSSVSQNAMPEAFFLCQGNAYSKILHLADPNFRTQAAKHFMDGSRIKEIQFLNIAGPNVSTKIICKHTTDILAHKTTCINAYISHITGFIPKNCKLDILVQGKKGNDTIISVGLNFVKIHKKLSFEKLGKINQLFSEMKDDVAAGVFPGHIIDALDYIQQVADKVTKSNLERDISKYAIDILTGKNNMSDCYLGHRYTEDWSKASDLKLYEKIEKKRSVELGCWPCSPSLAEVVKMLDQLFPSSDKLKEYLKEKKIELHYSRPGDLVKEPLQNFVHGYIKRPHGTYFKVAQNWFLFSSSLYEVLDRNFSYLSNLLLEQKDIKNIFKYPWYSKRMKIVASDPMVRTILGVNETVSEENLEKIFEVLTDDYELFDRNGSALFTKHSCLLPKSSNLRNMVRDNNSSDKRIGGARSAISTNNDVRPGPSNDSCQSVETMVDTASNSGQYVSTETVRVEKKKDKNKNDGTDTVRSKLFKICEKKSRDSKEFPKTISMLIKTKAHYLVTNAVVTDDVLKEIKFIEPSLKDTDIYNFLKSMSSLNENEFNELYLFPDVPDGYFVLPGDLIKPNNVELFDLLIHDRRNREKRTSYLFQNKKGFDYNVRDACAQIRNSAELLWHDFMCGHKRHIELFYEMVVESTTAFSAYRHFVKERLLTITKQEFLEMFDDDVKLVFVLAFAPKTAKHNQLLKWDFKRITSKTLIESDPKFGPEVHCALKETYILNELGYLSDSFIDMDQPNFQKVCGDHPKLKQLGIKKRNALHSFLKKHGTCDLSTIAKLELLTLDNCFNTFQIGGSGRRFNLQICHIKSC